MALNVCIKGSGSLGKRVRETGAGSRFGRMGPGMMGSGKMIGRRGTAGLLMLRKKMKVVMKKVWL